MQWFKDKAIDGAVCITAHKAWEKVWNTTQMILLLTVSEQHLIFLYEKAAALQALQVPPKKQSCSWVRLDSSTEVDLTGSKSTKFCHDFNWIPTLERYYTW
jgi:hypothetical protein